MASFHEIRNRLKGNSVTAEKGNAKTISAATPSGGSSFSEIRKKLKATTPGNTVDESFVNTFLSDADKYISGSEGAYNGMGFDNAASVYEDRQKVAKDLRSRSWAIQEFLRKNQGTIDAKTYNGLKSYLDEFDAASSRQMKAFYDKNRFYSQFQTKEAYEKHLQDSQDYAYMKDFDVTAGEEELQDMEAFYDDVYTIEPWYAIYKANPQRWDQQEISENVSKYNTLTEKYGSLQGLDKAIQEKKLFLANAKRLQDGLTMEAVADSESELYDPDFKAKSGYSSTQTDDWWAKMTSQFGMGYGDLTYEYINGAQNGMRQEIIGKALSFDADTDDFFIYDHMTDDQIAVYNYHYTKDGKAAAEKYLDAIRESLHYKEAAERFGGMEGNTALELLFGIEVGADQFQSGIKNLFNTEDDYIPQTAIQMAGGMVREDLADDGFKLPDWLGGASLGQMGYDTITTTTNMAPSIMTSMVIGTINPVAGQIAGTTLMGASAAGNAYQEALNLGYDNGQARAYSALVGGSEAGLQYLLGGFGKLGGKLSGNVITKIMNSVDNAFARTALKLGGNMLSEGLEEGLQEILTPWFKNMTLHMDEDVNWNEVAYSSLLGALTAGLMEGGTTISGEVNTYQTGKQLKAADISAERLSSLGQTFSADSVAYQLAGRVNASTDAYTMGRLFNEIGATLSEQNVTEITNALAARGMDVSTARKNAEALAYVVEGGQLSDRQIAAIEANDVLAEVARTTLIDANTTWNQRAQGYNQMLKALADEMTAQKASRTNPAQQDAENAPATDPVDARNEDGTESRSVAENVDTSPAKVKSITAIKDGRATIKLEDDTEVDVKEADLDPDDGVRIETIASIDGISATDANFLLNTLRTSSNASAQMDALGAKEAYRYGFYGFSQEHLAKHGTFANSLTETQRQAIYETGRNARQQQIEKATTKNGTGSKTEIYFDSGNGDVVAFQDAKKTLTEKQTAGVQAAMILRKLGIGGDIYFFESYRNSEGQLVYKDKHGKEVKAPNGWCSESDGSIHIDLNAGSKGQGFVLFTLAHELTHFVEQWSAQKYKVLADFLIENYEKGQSVNKLVRAKQAKLSDLRGKKVSYKEAYSEVVADSMEAMLADGNVLEKLMELKAKDSSLFMKMKQFFDNLLAKLRNIYKGQTPDSAEGRAVLEMTESIEKLQQLFAEALVDASENFQSAEKNTTREGGVKQQARHEGYGGIREVLAKKGLDELSKKYGNKFPLSAGFDQAMKTDKTPLTMHTVKAKQVTYSKNLSIYKAARNAFITAYGVKTSVHIQQMGIDAMLYADMAKESISKAVGKPNEQSTLDAIPRIREILSDSVLMGIERIAHTGNKGTALYGYRLYNLYWYDDGQKKTPNCLVCTVVQSTDSAEGYVFHNIENVTVEQDLPGNKTGMPPSLNSNTYTVAQLYKTVKKIDRGNGGLKYTNAEKDKYLFAYTERNDGVKYSDRDSKRDFLADDQLKESYTVSEISEMFDAWNSDPGTADLAKKVFAKLEEIIAKQTDAQKSLLGSGRRPYDIVFVRKETLAQSYLTYAHGEFDSNYGIAYNLDHFKEFTDQEKAHVLLHEAIHACTWEAILSAEMRIPQYGKDLELTPDHSWSEEQKAGLALIQTFNQVRTINGIRKKVCGQMSVYEMVAEMSNPEFRAMLKKHRLWNRIVDAIKRIFGIEHRTAYDAVSDALERILEMDMHKAETVRYSGGDTVSVSNRFLLANTFEGLAQTERELEAEVKYSIREAFYKEFDAWDKKDTNVVFTTGTTSNALRSIGMKDQDIILRSGTVLQKIKRHPEMTFNIFRDIPNLLEHPILIQFSDAIDPKTRRPKYDSSITVLGELYADVKEDGKKVKKPVLVSLELLPTNQKKTAVLDFAIIKSAYSKNALQQYINENSILYIDPDKKRTDSWLSLNRLQLPLGEKSYGPIRKIAYVDGKVKVQNSKNMTAMEKALFEAGKIDEFGNKIFSDRDSESVSNRSLLVNAFEGLAQHEVEKQKLQEYKDKIATMNAEEQKLQELNAQIHALSFAKGPRDTKKIRALRDEAIKITNRINIYDKQLLRLEASKPLQNVLEREKKAAYKRAEKKGQEALDAYRERATKAQKQMREKWQESRAKAVESRHKTEMRHKIQRVVKKLNDLLLRETKDKHVPEALKSAVADALDAINMDTVGAEERIAKYDALIAKETDPDVLQSLQASRDRIIQSGQRLAERIEGLKAAYDGIRKSAESASVSVYDEVIANKIQETVDMVGKTALRDMSYAQLEAVYEMYTMVAKSISNANKAFKEARGKTITEMGASTIREVRAAGGSRQYAVRALEGSKKFGWNLLKPYYAFSMIGSDTLSGLYENVRKGEDVWAKDVADARRLYRELAQKYGYDGWDMKKGFTFEDVSGRKFSLSLPQIMSLYAYSKRAQADKHLEKGGFVFDSAVEVVQKKNGIPVKYKVNTANAYNLTRDMINQIVDTLSNEQVAFVDEMQEYLSTVMGEKGNEVSMALYDVRLFKEKHYFPLKSASQYTFQQTENTGEVKLKNSGFSKATVANASNPVILSDFMNVWGSHVNDMSMYHAFVLPLEDFNRVYNYKTLTSEDTSTESVKGAVQNAYGTACTKYIKQLLEDINGGARVDDRASIINKWMGKFKKGSVFANASVVIQQPSAIARAAALVDIKYFIGRKIGPQKHQALWDEVKNYAPVAIIKEMGYFDTNMGLSTVEYITANEYSSASKKAKALFTDESYRDELLSRPAALADEISWCYIWEAVKRETAAKHAGMDATSEAFLKKAGERFTEVITRTQVYDSVLSRSGIMRSKDTGAKMLTAFMSEPTTNLNMVVDALVQGKRGDRQYARNAIGAVVASQIINSLLVSFVYAARDDDKDKTYEEKYLASFAAKSIESLNPLSYLPFIKDIVSIIRGYTVERSDMAVISDIWTAWQKLSNPNVSTYRKAEDFAGSVAQAFGLPLKNIMRDARSVWQTAASFFSGQDTTGAGIGVAIYEEITGKEISNGRQLYDAYRSGDSAQIARVAARFKTEADANSALRSVIREELGTGVISDKEAIDMLVRFGVNSQKDAEKKVGYWVFKEKYPNVELSEAKVATYQQDLAPVGITVEAFARFNAQASEISGEDRKARVVTLIHGMDLTPQQKDALYLTLYAKSGLPVTPWH